ncbi:MAG: dihydrofolate reductase [Gammaproteobacteria bacterium]|nr:dihydrofolate reductase [Gammaproteobacteria bacterium]
MLSLIVAMDRNRVIGKDGQLPWHLSADLKHFKAITMGKPIIMGRKTFDSIGRPLPGRRNIVVTRHKGFHVHGCECVENLAQAIELSNGDSEAVIIGGAQIYRSALPLVERMYITLIEHEFDGDAWFPEYNHAEWNLIESEKHRQQDDKTGFYYQFMTFDRIKF